MEKNLSLLFFLVISTYISLKEQEEISDDWTVEDDEGKRKRGVIRAEIAIRLKGRKRKPKKEEGDVLK